MQAIQYREIGKGPELVDIPVPEPEPGQVRIKVTAAGLCHSDWFIMGLPKEQFEQAYPDILPLTLGHEVVGIVDKLGEGATGVDVGTEYAVYGPWGCGVCHICAQGQENYCPRAAELGIRPPGLGAPGGMAEYMIVDSPRHLVPLGDLEPVQNVSLTDAGLTPYHAIMSEAPRLRAGSTAVVIGVGGLGHVGIQILRAATAATVIALDVSQDKLEFAQQVGAHHAFMSDESAIHQVRDLTQGHGADVVFDFTGIQPTVDLARQMVRLDGDIQIVGIGGGALPTGFGSTPFGVSVTAPYWGSRSELFETLDLARHGDVEVHVEEFPISEGVKAYQLLHEGKLQGRAVVVP